MEAAAATNAAVANAAVANASYSLFASYAAVASYAILTVFMTSAVSASDDDPDFLYGYYRSALSATAWTFAAFCLTVIVSVCVVTVTCSITGRDAMVAARAAAAGTSDLVLSALASFAMLVTLGVTVPIFAEIVHRVRPYVAATPVLTAVAGSVLCLARFLP